MLYGVFVNLMMEQVILRLTPLPAKVFILGNSYINWVLFGIVFGIPIVHNAYKYYGVEDK